MASNTPDRVGGRGDAAAQVHDRARIVRRYLSALDMRRAGRSAARTSESISHRIHQVDTLLLSADPVQRLHLTQERIDLHAELLRISAGASTDVAEAEAAFVRVVRGYSERHGITFSAWRQIGVDSDVLERGGIVATKASRPGRPVPAAQPSSKPVVAEPKPVAAKAESVVAEPQAVVAKPAAPDASCLSELPPVPPAADEQTGPAAKAGKKAAAANGEVKKRAAAAGPAPAKRARSAKKTADPAQQQLPAESSS